jgi:hypothetical protein
VGGRFGVWLEPEVRMAGFGSSDLAPLREEAGAVAAVPEAGA